MPSWDDPTVKWDDPLYGFNGGTPVTRVPTWSDSLSTWGDAGEGWNGENGSGDVQYGVPPGLYVKHPLSYANGLQATIVTTGVPGQPATDLSLFLKIVVPGPSGSYPDYVEFDRDGGSAIPIPYRTYSGWTSIGSGDDGQTAATPAWFSTGTIYKRQGNTVWVYLGPDRGSYSARVRLENGPWVDCLHIAGVPTTLNPPLPPGVYRVQPTQFSAEGPQAMNAGVRKDANVVAQLGQTVWRRAGYSQPTLTVTGGYGDVSYFRIRSDPVGAQVYGYVGWEDTGGTVGGWVAASFGPVADNTAVYTNMCMVVSSGQNQWIGGLASAITGFSSVWPMGPAGRTFYLDSHTLVGAGTSVDPYQSSAQHHLTYQPN
jgi:hypothetical protein